MKKKNSNIFKFKVILGCISALIVIINIIFAIQAYNFTHFKDNSSPKTKISDTHNIKTILTGINIPKPITQKYPNIVYDSVNINNKNEVINAWILKTSTKKNKGLIIFFHGYTAEKSEMLDYACQTLDMGYDAMLIDFRASGKSSGNQSTMGYLEAKDVKAAVDYARKDLKESHIILFGFSMGAAAIIKAQHDYTLPIEGIIVEAPYSNFRETIKTRAELVGGGVFSNLASYIFCFWIAATNFIDPFSMKPEEYAKNIHVPVLVACGANDQYINPDDALKVFDNFKSENKTFKIYSGSKHGLYIYEHPEEWKNTVQEFLKTLE